MQIPVETVNNVISHGGASAIEAAKSEVDKIAAQINAGLAVNEVEKVSYTIDMKIACTIDVEKRTVVVEGRYGAKTPNLGKAGRKIEAEIDDPNQITFSFDNTEGAYTPEDEDDEIEEVDV